MRIVGSRAEAEDVLHDVFVEVWKRAADFDAGRGTVRNWLAIRMRSRCLDRQKSPRVARRVPLDDDEAAHWRIGVDTVDYLCSIISFHHYDLYLEALVAGDLHRAIQVIMTLYDRGFSVMDVLDNFFSYVKHSDRHGLTDTNKYHLTTYLCKYIAFFHNLHEDEIELVLLTNNIFRYFQSESIELSPFASKM
jgi:hypothetical protein